MNTVPFKRVSQAVAQPVRARVLVAHPWMARGGSESVAAWCLEALQGSYEVTLVTAADVDLEAVNAAFGTRIDPALVRVVRAPRLPGATGPGKMVALQHATFARYVRRFSHRFDAVVSAYNFLPTHVPTVQLVADFSWDDDALAVANGAATAQILGFGRLPRRMYRWVAQAVAAVADPASVKRTDLVVSNSDWTKRLLKAGFGVETDAVLAPPVPLTSIGPTPGTTRDPMQFVCLGRISPEKRIEEVIGVLSEVRASGRPVRLVVAGPVPKDDYGRKVYAVVQQNSEWVSLPGFLDFDHKRRLMSESSYAFHGCEGEAFGIAVGEYVACGCVPFVPVSGAARELVPDPCLWYSSRQDAVRKVLAALDDPRFAASAQRRVHEASAELNPVRFCERLRELVATAVSRKCVAGTNKRRRDRLALANAQWEAEGRSSLSRSA